MKIKVIIFSLVFLFFGCCDYALAESSQVNVYFFWGSGCPHCAKEEKFLEFLESKYPQIKLRSYEVWNNADNRQLLMDLGKKMNVNISGVPFTVVGEHYFTGWYDEKSTGKAIEDAINCALENGCRDVASEIVNEKKQEGDKASISAIPQSINVPVIGEIETKHLSLPVLTIIFGALDGFNPCAMWVLLFLISLLLGMENKKKMWILGSTFIVASALVYFLFMTAWLNLLLFIGFIFLIRIVIGVVALLAGGYNLKEYFTNPTASCKVTGAPKRQKIFAKLKAITQQESFYLALGGIILLAFAVNLVELICSAGFPAVYTQILAISNLSGWQHYFYILLYIVIFLLDDLFVFVAAMVTLQTTGITTKYTRISYLIGGILMVVIGILLILKPEWLMFG